MTRGVAGSITLVGAGPGAPDLITVRGARALAVADVVVHDRLVDSALLDLAPDHAEVICVGKGKGCGVRQDEIEALVIARARAGANVVRLKGGDPFVFGRGAEEVTAAVAARIPVTVVPGVSSALAAPAAAGIPVTHRDVASACTIVTGHRAGARDHDWPALARAPGTLVVLMAASTAAAFAGRLMAAGRPGDEPVAVVHAATTDHQRVQRVTVAELAAGGVDVRSPSVIVLGEVARFAAAGPPACGRTAPPLQLRATTIA